MKRNLQNVIWPAAITFIITLLLSYIANIPYFEDGHIFENLPFMQWLVINILPCLLVQLLAFLTCWFFVMRKTENVKLIWINYLVWFLIDNVQNIIEIIDRFTN